VGDVADISEVHIVGDVADVSEVHAASIIRIKVECLIVTIKLDQMFRA
jgi:hypothetical protein